jgi:hypothetical protein
MNVGIYHRAEIKRSASKGKDFASFLTLDQALTYLKVALKANPDTTR